MMTFTPGPWKGHGKWPTNIKDEDGEMIATVWNIGEDVAPHNAHLIAAAPEMFKALEGILDINNPPWGEPGHVDFTTAIKMGRKALAQVGE